MKDEDKGIIACFKRFSVCLFKSSLAACHSQMQDMLVVWGAMSCTSVFFVMAFLQNDHWKSCYEQAFYLV